MLELDIYQVDAFSDRPFAGNPAAVVPLRDWLDDAKLLSIAEENNLSETAFFVERDGRRRLRWFTPTAEVELCGHATLATGHVLFEELGVRGDRLEFDSRSGVLGVQRHGDSLVLDFPRWTLTRSDPQPALEEGLGASPGELWLTGPAENYLAVYRSEEEIRALRPNFSRLATFHPLCVIVTAPGDDCDFVSRYFAPSFGINEDPVTGSIHCALTPYWAERLGKSDLSARQVSPRGGQLQCSSRDDRVGIAGRAVTYLRGKIWV